MWKTIFYSEWVGSAHRKWFVWCATIQGHEKHNQRLDGRHETPGSLGVDGVAVVVLRPVLDCYLTENETLFPSCSMYFYYRITYIVPIAEPHMKLESECTETGLQPCICLMPRNHRKPQTVPIMTRTLIFRHYLLLQISEPPSSMPAFPTCHGCMIDCYACLLYRGLCLLIHVRF